MLCMTLLAYLCLVDGLHELLFYHLVTYRHQFWYNKLHIGVNIFLTRMLDCAP